ncbi:MAG: hypothetical protein ACREHC_04685 [Candidatus Levyibacteriota bacterium]
MSRTLTVETAARLQQLLSKRLGRQLSPAELELAYNTLIDFAVSLLELNEIEPNFHDHDKACKWKN